MSLIDNLKRLFKKGAYAMAGNQLNKLTDDPRVNMTSREVDLINQALKYYADDMGVKHFVNADGVKKTRQLHSLAITRQACRSLASVIFDEQAKIAIDSKLLNDFIDDVLTDNNFYQLYEEYLEIGIAAGGFAIRPYVENDKIKLAWIRADQFYPLESNTNRVNSAAVVSKTTLSKNGMNKYYSLVEFHIYSEKDQTETITNELYVSDNADIIGQQVPLSELEKYQQLAPQVTIANLVCPTFAYFKAPGKNNIVLESPLGIGIVANSRKVIDDLNTAHDQLYRELELGRRRVAISGAAMKPSIPQAGDSNVGPHFDEDDDVFLALQGSNGDPEKPFVQQLEPNLRIDEYHKAIQAYINEFENQIGLSQGTLSTNATEGDKTATEVVSDNSQTYRTRSSYCTQVEKQIKWLIYSIIEIAQCSDLFTSKPLLSDVDLTNPLDINITFNDGIFVDSETKQKSDLELVTASIMSKKKFLMNNLGMTKDEAEEELAAVEDESVMGATIPNTQRMAFGDGDDGGE